MKLGIGSYTYAWSIGIAGYPIPNQPLDALALIQRAHQLGLTLVQIADNLPLHSLSENALDDLCRQAQQSGIDLEVGTRGIAPDHLRCYLGLARQLGSRILRTVIDTPSHHPEPSEVVQTLRGIMSEFEAANVRLAIENHDRFRVHQLVEILQAVDSEYLGICLDTVNSFGAGEGPEVVVATLGPYVINLHIKDFTIRRHPSMLGFEVQGTPAGQGMLNVPWLLKSLRHAARQDFNSVLELWTPPESTTEQTIEKESRWVEESLAYLRRLIPG